MMKSASQWPLFFRYRFLFGQQLCFIGIIIIQYLSMYTVHIIHEIIHD